MRHALDNLSPRRLIIFSRDEQRLLRAMHNVDHVVHAAALKQVDTAE